MPFTPGAIAPSSALQEVAFAPETTPGGTLSANYYVLPEIGFDGLNDVVNGKPFTKPGSLFASSMQQGKRWAMGSWSGIAGYNTLLFVGRSALNKGVVTTPTRSNTYNLTITPGATTSTYTFAGANSAAISDNTTPGATMAAALQTGLNAITTVGPGAFKVEVTGVANVYKVTVAPFYDFAGALTVSAGNAVLANTAATNTRRWRINVSPNRRSDIQTFGVKKGMVDVASEAVSSPYGFFTGISFNFTQSEATMSGGYVCQTLNMAQTLANSELVYLPSAPVNMNSFQIAIGLAKTQAGGAFAVEKLCDIANVSMALSDKEKPFVNIGCDDAGFAAHVTNTPGTNVTVGVLANVNGRLIRDWVLQGLPIYLCIYSKGAVIEGNYNYQMRILTPVYLVDLPSNNSDGAMTYQFTGSLATANGDSFELIIDTPIANFN